VLCPNFHSLTYKTRPKGRVVHNILFGSAHGVNVSFSDGQSKMPIAPEKNHFEHHSTSNSHNQLPMSPQVMHLPLT